MCFINLQCNTLESVKQAQTPPKQEIIMGLIDSVTRCSVGRSESARRDRAGKDTFVSVFLRFSPDVPGLSQTTPDTRDQNGLVSHSTPFAGRQITPPP